MQRLCFFGGISSLIMNEIAKKAVDSFTRRFGQKPDVTAIAPGRLELLGNHTDYNEGLVLGLAINRYIAISGKRTSAASVRIYSSAYQQIAEFDLNAIAKDNAFKWANYPKGIVAQFIAKGYPLSGFDLCIETDIPLGAGVSSSAAFLIATALCIEGLFGIDLDPMGTARLCHAAERDFAGANNGLLDHFCSMFGRQNHVLYLDCRTLEYEISPVHAAGFTLVVSQTNVRHSIIEGEYQVRRRQCAEAAAFLATQRPGISALRDVTRTDLDRFGSHMREDLLQRARHIVGENDRVKQGKGLLAAGDLNAFGRLLYDSHESSRVYFENSCPELDIMVDIARSVPGVYGSRLTGGGFGGCALALVHSDSAQRLAEAVRRDYPTKTGKKPDVFFCNISDGGQLV